MSEERKNGTQMSSPTSESLRQNVEKMKEMVNGLRSQIVELSKKNDLLENEVQSSVRLLWAAAYAQPDHTLKIPKANLEKISPYCQLESGYDPTTGETFFKAVIVDSVIEKGN